MKTPSSEDSRPESRRSLRKIVRGLTFGFLTAGLGLLLLVGTTNRIGSDPGGWLAVPALVLPHLATSIGLGVLLFALGTRPKKWPRRLLAAWALVVGVIWIPGWFPRGAIGKSDPVRVISWNVQRLGEFAPWLQVEEAEREALQCVANAILREDPDLVTLLEISARRLEDLADRASLTCVHTPYLGEGPSVGGLAACVRGDEWTLTQARDLPLPPDWRYVFAELERGDRRLNLVSIHLRPPGISGEELRETLGGLADGEPEPLLDLGRTLRSTTRAQDREVAELLADLQTFRDPTVVAGDFNSTPDTAIHATLRKTLVDSWMKSGLGLGATRTFGDWLPLRIDFIYLRDLVPGSATVLDDPCSDHKGLVATVGW